MLYSTDSQTYMKPGYVPHSKSYELWKSRLTGEELAAMKTELSRRLDACEVTVSSWIPGNDWAGTVFEPLWSKAALQNENVAALAFGLVLWETLMERDEVWGFVKWDGTGGTAYFRIKDPPAGDE